MFIVKGWAVACNIEHEDRENCQGILVANLSPNASEGEETDAHIIYYEKKDAMQDALAHAGGKIRRVDLHVYEDSDKINE